MYCVLFKTSKTGRPYRAVMPTRRIADAFVLSVKPLHWRIRDKTGYVESSSPTAYKELQGRPHPALVFWTIDDV